MNKRLLTKLLSIILICISAYSCRVFTFIYFKKIEWETGTYIGVFGRMKYYFNFEKNIFIYGKKSPNRSIKNVDHEISEGSLLYLSKNTYLLESKERSDVDDFYNYVLFRDTLVLYRRLV